MSLLKLVKTKVGVIPIQRSIHSSYPLLNSSSSKPIVQEGDSLPVNQILAESTNQKELISGAPAELSTPDTRLVRIYKEAKAATQSSARNSKFWKVDWDVLPKQNRWENDLMGYQSSSDYMQGTIMQFESKESAVAFAKGQGWDYYIQEPKTRKFKQKDYSSNFYHSVGPLKHIRTK
ncbi:hypothetical protein CANARDRAFT_28763 [[Candida] arabinofermentans NRRL YB-2248]|uniref:NADH dehydrogenase [ubiquinone] iron-sulfur protein 4, mitochondrial n=1 Tax=[Candida] arabinofermentans NRRL YB-2248 TaxID=983967 RepID=A0A1E4SZW3_9ASCO|nr:hypothetical protein CANARDRAFT_28763 [[Candida] arabinofermentans NRRL YB-2248]